MLVPENMDIVYLEAVSKSRLALQRPRGSGFQPRLAFNRGADRGG